MVTRPYRTLVRSGGERTIHIRKVTGSNPVTPTNTDRLRSDPYKAHIISKVMNSLNIEKEKTALVVIDLQKGIVERYGSEPYDAVSVVANSAKLADTFRKNKMPVFLVRVTPSPDKKDGLKPITDTTPFAGADMDSDWGKIVSELGPMPEDFIITKRQWGAFYGTELDLQLRRRGITTIVLCGISTNIGVESTARDAYERGYQQIFAEDAMTAHSTDGHKATTTLVFPRIGRVRRMEEIVKELE